MDKELKQQFQEKNLEILKNKLKLDVSNNMNTLTLSLNHILDLEVSSALQKFGNIYLDAGAKFKEKEQQKILIQIGQKYLEETKAYLKQKRNDFLTFIDEFSFEDSIETYYDVILNAEKDFSEILKNKLVNYIEIKLNSSIIKMTHKYISKEKQEFVLERTINFLTDHFVRRLVDKTIEQINMRSYTLVNNAKDNYSHYNILPTIS